MKLAFVVQRYGREILGGAETLARQIAERLARRHDIDVLTTTARDYVTWREEYPAGEEKLRGVRIKRFPVRGERNLEEFNRYSEWIYKNDHSHEDELKWLEMQGPVVPELVDYLRQSHRRYDLLVFFTYLYYPTYYGLKVAPEKSALLPTAHDEPPLALEIYTDVFGLPSSLIFNTEAEELLVLERFGSYKKMRETIGIGMDLLDQPDATAFRRRHKLSGRYLLYAGRIDAGKGCEELLRYFRFYKEERPDAGNLQLVLIGKQSMRLPNARDIRYLGFLDEDEKLAAMAGSLAVVVPSRLESLSIVALEAFSVGSPVIGHAGSRVLVDHCRKANAGLYYSDYEEFEQVLDLMLADKNLVRGMGKLAQRYIKDHFGWEKLLNQYELAFRASARRSRPASRPAEDTDEPLEPQAPSRKKTTPVEEAVPAEASDPAAEARRDAEAATTEESRVADGATPPAAALEGTAVELPEEAQTEAAPKDEEAVVSGERQGVEMAPTEQTPETSSASTIIEPGSESGETVPEEPPKDVAGRGRGEEEEPADIVSAIEEPPAVEGVSTEETPAVPVEEVAEEVPAEEAPSEERPLDDLQTEASPPEKAEEGSASEDIGQRNDANAIKAVEEESPDSLGTADRREVTDSKSTLPSSEGEKGDDHDEADESPARERSLD
jgi:glycosyltransferase involved in cell wall biosynthesis